MSTSSAPAWQKTACILCSLNCGLEVQTGGGSGREILKVRGDKAHPASRGYLCEKPRRLRHYQSAGDRLTSPLRRRPDGTYEPVDWDTAIAEVAERLRDVKRRFGGDKILYYGGGGQGNHLGGVYGDATLKALGVKYRSNALAQEKTGEFWVGGKMVGAPVHGDFEHASVAVFIGKNPWQSHGFARSRVVLKEIIADPERTLIVIDPRVSETAARADIHLQLKPGTDAWCLAAIAATIVQEDLVHHDWVDEHTDGFAQIEPLLRDVHIAQFAEVCGVPEDQLRQTARLIAAAPSVSMFEDLGMQMNRHSTLGSYLQRLTWMLTGHFAKRGAHNPFVPFFGLNKVATGVGKRPARANRRKSRTSPVTKSKIIIGLIPCNVMSEEILADHPDRFRAMIIESGNPVHSIADSPKMREAMAALEFSVVIDVAMTETARCADYVLPASSQFEKAECTFFNLEVEDNVFHVRRALFSALPGTLPEAEIHSRLVEALTPLDDAMLRPLRWAARLGRAPFAAALAAFVARHRWAFDVLPVLVYRSLGETLPEDAKESAILWVFAQLYTASEKDAAGHAGYGGLSFFGGNRLFQDLLDARTGVVFARTVDAVDGWKRVGTPGGRLQLAIPELFGDLVKLSYELPTTEPDYPYWLSAGERRSETTNTILRDPASRPKRKGIALRMAPSDADALGVSGDDLVRVTTRRGSCTATVEITNTMQSGHVSLPNGLGLSFGLDQSDEPLGVPPNELTRTEDRDRIAGTPWHKTVPARLERVAPAPGPADA